MSRVAIALIIVVAAQVGGCRCGSDDQVDAEFEQMARASKRRQVRMGPPPAQHPSGPGIPLGLSIDVPDVGPRPQGSDPWSANTSTAAGGGATTIRDMFTGKIHPSDAGMEGPKYYKP